MLSTLIEERMEALKLKAIQPSIVLEDTTSDWYAAKMEVNRLTGDFQKLLDSSDPIKRKVNIKGKDKGITVELAPVKGNQCFIQVVEINKELMKARYMMYQKNGHNAYIRDLLTVI